MTASVCSRCSVPHITVADTLVRCRVKGERDLPKVECACDAFAEKIEEKKVKP